MVDAIADRVSRGTQIVLVSSGAIGAGLAPLSLGKRPRDLATQQAAASVGQLALAHAYAESFGRYSLTVGQVLLTSDDVVRRAHYRNAQNTFTRLLALGAVPVVNENDTVATEEIRFGDNDRLAALVAHLIGADALVLLSDVDGLYDGDPRDGATRKIAEVTGESDVDGITVGMSSSGLGTGGMVSKLAAARTAMRRRDPGPARCGFRGRAGPDHRRGRHGFRRRGLPVVGPPVLAGLRRGRVRETAPRRRRGHGRRPPSPLVAGRRDHRRRR